MVSQEWNRSVLGPKEGSFSELCFGVALAVEVKRTPKLVGDLSSSSASRKPTNRQAGTPRNPKFGHPLFIYAGHTLNTLSSKSDPGRLYVSLSLVCLEKSQGIERFCRIQARTTALLNQQQAQLTDDRRIDIHGNPQRLRLIREKFSQTNKLRKY